MAYKFVDGVQLDADLTAIANAIREKGETSDALEFPTGMVSAISAISTGVELNFRIVDGLTQPATGKENDIWVAVEKVTGYYFQAEQPEEMADGEVWISTGTSSTVAFNALKKGTIMVYPLSAKQMVSGELVDVTAKSYQDGGWVKWIPEGALYYQGNECDSTTGGWVARATGQSGGGWTPTAPTKVILDKKMIVTFSDIGGINACGVIETANKIDLTNINTIVFDISEYVGSGTGASMMCVAVYNQGDNPYSGVAAKASIAVGDDATKIDVSLLSGSYVVGIFAWQNYGTETRIVVDEIMQK